MKVLALLLLLPALALAEGSGTSPTAPQAAGLPAPATDTATAAPGTPEIPEAAPVAAPPWAAGLRRDARAVLQGDDFHRVNTSRNLVARDWLKRWLKRDPEKAPATQPPFSLAAVAKVLKWLLAGVLVVALVWLLWRGWQWLAPRIGQREPARAWQALEAQSLLLSGEDLPEAIGSAARKAWARGEGALALSLLYRGAVQSLAAQYRIELPESATEGECLRLARRSGKAVVSEGFAPIVRAWMALAYARRAPDDFEHLATLFDRHFDTRAGGRP